MASTALTGIGTIWSDGGGAADKTLIISAHGRSTGSKFTPAYATSLQFASPKYGALLAALTAAINGTATATEVATPGSKVEDHALAWYEDDPSSATIVANLAGKKFDVLTIKPTITSTRQAGAPTLSGVISRLSTQDLKYPAILGLFCRVVKDVATGATLMGHDVVGGTHATVALQAEKMKNAISIAQAIKARNPNPRGQDRGWRGGPGQGVQPPRWRGGPRLAPAAATGRRPVRGIA